MEVRARAHLHALKTRKSCAVGMRNAKLWNHLEHVHSTIVAVKQSREYEVHTGRTVDLNVISRSEKNIQTTSSSRLFCKLFSHICLKMSWYCKEILNICPESALKRHISIIQDKLSIQLTTKEHTKVNVKRFRSILQVGNLIYQSLHWSQKLTKINKHI